jgi:hypothetical protein
MLIKKQILIPKWMDEYLKKRSEATGLSEGELVRFFIGLGSICSFKQVGIVPKKELFDRLQKFIENEKKGKKIDKREIEAYFSDVYFEARKLAEEFIK